MLDISKEITSDDFDAFRRLFSDNIVKLYPFTTMRTADSIIQTHVQGVDCGGGFTKRKTIWKALSNYGETIAFTVVSEKRGGSIKFGPTIVETAKRSQGIGAEFRLRVEDYYAQKGYRKAYSTTGTQNNSAIQYLLKIDYKIELHLKDHYLNGADEFVLSKFLKSPAAVDCEVENTFHNLDYVKEYLYTYYDEMDSSFFTDNLAHTAMATFEKNEEFFIQKKKSVFMNPSFGQYALFAPKRGDCAKASPLIMGNSVEYNSKFIDQLINFGFKNKIRKIYTFIPMICYESICQLKNFGFYTEGVIVEPYKVGVDLIMLSIITH
jgi:RimJ/RimL family protein N-acetyltransferase